MYLIWYSDSKQPSADKIAAGCMAYRERFGIAPTIVLVNEADLAVIEGVRVEPRAHIPRSNFWIGMIVEEGRR